jgi:hypothetical protein
MRYLRLSNSIGLAERVRAALVTQALAAFEDAATQGLCCEGAWEAAVSAMRRADLTSLLEPPAAPEPDASGRR